MRILPFMLVCLPLDSERQSGPMHIALDNPEAARDFTAGLVRRCRLIGSNPFIGRRRSELGFDIRVFTFRGYRICYEVVEDRVDIIRIIEPKRDIEGQFE